jgi:hypothetical protein
VAGAEKEKGAERLIKVPCLLAEAGYQDVNIGFLADFVDIVSCLSRI